MCYQRQTKINIMTQKENEQKELRNMQERIKAAYFAIYGELRGSIPTTIESCKMRIKWFYLNLDYIV